MMYGQAYKVSVTAQDAFRLIPARSHWNRFSKTILAVGYTVSSQYSHHVMKGLIAVNHSATGQEAIVNTCCTANG